MKKIIFTTAAFLLFLLSTGCQGHTITKEQAIQTVKSQYGKDNNFGRIKIISVVHKYGKYAVKWERKSNCEAGMDYVDDSNGKITGGVHQIC